MHIGAIIDGPRNIIYFPGQGNIILKCNVTDGIPLWMVNGSTFTLNQLAQGALPGHNHDGTNIVIETPVNNTKYVCESLISTNYSIRSGAAFVYIAGELSIGSEMHVCICIQVNFKKLLISKKE